MKEKFIYVLAKGKLTVILLRKPLGGYLTNGNDNVGTIDITVPGGRAILPSFVIQRTLF